MYRLRWSGLCDVRNPDDGNRNLLSTLRRLHGGKRGFVMAVRTIWKGDLKMGSAKVPVKLYSAAQDQTSSWSKRSESNTRTLSKWKSWKNAQKSRSST
jgi:hypothetical protein